MIENKIVKLVLLNCMKLIYKIFGLTKKSKKTFLLTTNRIPNTKMIKSIPISEKYPDMDEDELYLLLEEKENNNEELTDEEKKFLEDRG